MDTALTTCRGLADICCVGAGLNLRGGEVVGAEKCAYGCYAMNVLKSNYNRSPKKKKKAWLAMNLIKLARRI